jgi:hypothetical protein
MPHRWIPSLSAMSLAEIEKQCVEQLKQKKDIKELITLRGQLQNELAAERRSLPHRRAEAEREVNALSARLTEEVGLHLGEKRLAQALKHPAQILLPTKDDKGKDIAASLEQYEPWKGLRGALGKLTESHERREMRSRLETAKENYLGHLEGEVKACAGYHRALQSITKDCYELSGGYGYSFPAASALPAGKIAEIRAYAVRQPDGIAKPWLNQCAQAQALLDDWNAKPYRERESAERVLPQSEDRERTEIIQREMREKRQERWVPLPPSVVVSRELPEPVVPERTDRNKTSRSGRGGR